MHPATDGRVRGASRQNPSPLEGSSVSLLRILARTERVAPSIQVGCTTTPRAAAATHDVGQHSVLKVRDRLFIELELFRCFPHLVSFAVGHPR